MHRTSRRLAGASLLAAITIITAAGAAIGQDEEVIISSGLEPATLEVPEGAVVTWRNEDDERHRIRSRQGPVEFDSGNLEPGERFSVTFVVAGEYPYLDEHDDENPAYFGTVIVRGSAPSEGPPPLSSTVTLIDESFQPPALEVAVGATVTWENIDGDDDHTVTATEGAFNSGILPAGSAFEHTFDAPGTFDYFCAIHPEMTGTVSVVGDAPTTETATPATTADPALDPAATTDTGPVSIIDLTFDPAVIEVPVGTTVEWSNDDPFDHTVTAQDGTFNSAIMGSGDRFEHTFDTEGSFEYFCAIHPTMTGTVVVTPAEGG